MDLQYTDIFKQISYSGKLSRLIAQENIGIEFSADANTASFDPVNRVLRFPYNTVMIDADVHDLFMMHEVSHALHLPHDVLDTIKGKCSHSAFNIVIDVRDERLIKEKYPGATGCFTRGYRKLVDQGFFGDVKTFKYKSFPDRLNIYAKCGPGTVPDIKFDTTELDFYNRCMEAETIDDVIALAKELENFDRTVNFEEAFEEMFGEEDLEEMTLEELAKLKAQLREELEKKSQEEFDKSLESGNIQNASFHTFVRDTSVMDRYVDAKTYVSYVKDHYTKAWNLADGEYETITESVRATRKMVSQSVDSMVRVFETNRAASRYRNAKISDTGSIDANKLFKYQVDDKIFRRATKLPNQKNHGYIIALDFSGSMTNCIKHVIEQIVVISEFFRRIQVPFKVIGFGATARGIPGMNRFDYTPPKNTFAMMANDNFIEFLNSDMSTNDHNIALSGMIAGVGYDLSGTPTANTMVMLDIIADKFFNSLKIDRRHVVLMTDGSPTDVTYGMRSFGLGRVTTNIIVDSMTKTICKIDGHHEYAPIQALGEVLKARHNIEFSTISILSSVNSSNTSPFFSRAVTDSERRSFISKGFLKVTDSHKSQPIFFAKPFSVDSEVGVSEELDISEKSSSAIARALAKNMKGVKKSRNFLNALAESLS